MNKWEKCYSRSGCPYYLNFRTMRSQWEHPYFAQVLTEAADYNDVIYAAYRTALKLLHIRNNHHLQSLDVDKISNAFSETIPLHGIRVSEYLTLSQLESVVSRLYLHCDTPLHHSVWTGAVSSCLLYFFDGKKKGTVNVLSVLVLLITLSSDKLVNKYAFLFQCLNQHDLVGAQDISHLKKIVFTILTRLNEDKPYKSAYEGNGTTMTKEMFLKWLLSEPKFIVWLSTLHRIHAAVSVRHTSIKCYRCKNCPVIGLRYRCLQCFGVDLCFQCFTRIPAYGRHDKSHAIEEYCLPSKKTQDVKAFLTKICNNVKKKSRHSKPLEFEFDLTGRRQPATVWHDSRFSDLSECQSSMDDELSSAIVSQKSQISSSSRGAVIEYCPSLTRSGRVPDVNDEHNMRYSQSLPRRKSSRSSTQSPDQAKNIKISVIAVRDGSDIAPQLPEKLVHSPRSSKGHAEKSAHEKSTGTTKYLTSQHSDPYNSGSNTSELDFYSSSTRHAVPYVTSSHKYPSNHHPVGTSKPKVSRDAGNIFHNTICSEDEGIVVNSESDSSMSQFASFDTRDLCAVTGQPSLPNYTDSINCKLAVSRLIPVKQSKYLVDYGRQPWNTNCEIFTADSSSQYDYNQDTLKKSDHCSGSPNKKAFDVNLTYKKPSNVVDGMYATSGTIIRAYQV